MSYEIVKSIKVKDNKVIIKSCSNNVRPRTPHEWECSPLTTILKEKGLQALEVAILKDYESGDFQGTANKYTKALHILRNISEYKDFDWRSDWETSRNNKNRVADFEALLVKALITKLPSEKFVIIKKYRGDEVAYFNKRANAHFCRWSSDVKKATKFSFIKDAEWAKKCFYGSENWQVIAI